MAALSDMALSARLACREMRGSLRGFRVFAACLVLGVAAIAGVGSLTNAILMGLSQEGRTLLGGDVSLSLSQRPASEDELAYIHASGVVSLARSLRSMVRNLNTEDRRLAEVKAVDAFYPLYGVATLDTGAPLQNALAKHNGRWGAVLAPELAENLNAKPGHVLRLGELELEFRGVLTKEPDNAADGFDLAPRLMVATGALNDSGLLRQGALVRHTYRIKLPEGSDIKTWRYETEERFPDAGWRMRDSSDGAPQVREFTARVGQFLMLVGLATLVVGGVGVAGAVRSYLRQRTETIATLKALGAESHLVRRMYMMQIILIAAPCIALGLALGAMAPAATVAVAGDLLPFAPVIAVFPVALFKAAAAGVLVAILFTLIPLEEARRVPPARLYRQQTAAHSPAWSKRVWAHMIIGGGLLAALPLMDTDQPLFIAGFIAATLMAFALLWGAGFLLEWLVRKLPRAKWLPLRLGLSNLSRPGAPTRATVLALGLGLTLFATLALVQANLTRQIAENLPERAPAFYFIDIQRADQQRFKDTVLALEGVESVEMVPYMRGRIIALNGRAADDAAVAPGSRWALRGDRGLTFATNMPADNRLVAGEWWSADYQGPPAISFDAELAKGMGLQVGDHMTISVMGRDITARIMSLREIEWGSLAMNFAIVFDPHTLAAAPYTYLATVSVTPTQEAAVFRHMTDAFPSVSAVRMKEVLEEVKRMVTTMGAAVQMAALVTIFAGVLVLAGATAASQRAHIYDAVVLKLLGGTRPIILASLIIEYMALGLAAGLAAAGLGSAAAWVVVVPVMNMTWGFDGGVLAVTLAFSIGLTVLLGLLGTGAALNARPAWALRSLAR